MRSLRVLVGIATGLAVAGIWVASEARAQAPPTGGCYWPLDAVEEYLAFMEPRLDAPQLSPDPQTCRSQCATIRAGCHKVLGAAVQCKHGIQFGTANWDKLACKDEQGPARQQCIQVLNQNHVNFEMLLQDSREQGHDLCEGAFDDCVTFCNAPG